MITLLLGRDASTGQIASRLALAFITGATLFAIRAMRDIDRAVCAAQELLDLENEEPLS